MKIELFTDSVKCPDCVIPMSFVENLSKRELDELNVTFKASNDKKIYYCESCKKEWLASNEK